MKIEANEQLTHPAQLVFETVRDKQPELAAMMPNVERIEVLEQRREGSVVHLYNRWQGSKRDVPAVIRPFVSHNTTAWFDSAAWDDETLSCAWEITSIVGRHLFACTGNTTIRPREGGCSFELSGELKVNPNNVPGVPRFLGRKLQGPLERFIVNAVSPNITSVATAVQRYLDEQAGAVTTPEDG